MYGLLGRNGAGKTTLLRIMDTLLRPSEGEITFDGVPLEETGRVRSLMGYLPQEFSFYPDMSVEEILRYLAALSELPAGIQRERIPRLLRQVNLWEYRGRKARRLSGEMKLPVLILPLRSLAALQRYCRETGNLYSRSKKQTHTPEPILCHLRRKLLLNV